MTHSPTPAELLAIRTGNAALLNSPDASCDIVSTIVFALGSACLLQSPETAAEFERLRVRVAELEAAAGNGSTRTVDEDPIAYALTELATPLTMAQLDELRSCCAGPVCTCTPLTPPDDDVSPQVQKLRGILAGQREDAYRSPLHHDYQTPHDLPEVTP